MQAFEYYNNNIPTCGGISTLKYGLEALPHQMLIDLIYTQIHVGSSSHFSSLKRVESQHFPYMANHPGRLPIWVTLCDGSPHLFQPKMNWHKFEGIKQDKQTENQMLYSKQLSNEEPPWNQENSHWEHQERLTTKLLKVFDAFVPLKQEVWNIYRHE